MPGGPANHGGSFLAIPKACRQPREAFEIISWILDPANQARGFTDAALFPSAPAATSCRQLTGRDAFFGGQKTIESSARPPRRSRSPTRPRPTPRVARARTTPS